MSPSNALHARPSAAAAQSRAGAGHACLPWGPSEHPRLDHCDRCAHVLGGESNCECWIGNVSSFGVRVFSSSDSMKAGKGRLTEGCWCMLVWVTTRACCFMVRRKMCEIDGMLRGSFGEIDGRVPGGISLGCCSRCLFGSAVRGAVGGAGDGAAGIDGKMLLQGGCCLGGAVWGCCWRCW